MRRRLIPRLIALVLAMAALPVMGAFAAAGEEAIVEESVEENIPAEEGEEFPVSETEETITVPTTVSDPAAGYIANAMPHKTLLQAFRYSGYFLSSPTYELYDQLRSCVSDVADGTSTSTEFRISVDKLVTNTFTAEELGLETVLEVDKNGNSVFTSEAKAAAKAALMEGWSGL